jgi:hypothetical protein
VGALEAYFRARHSYEARDFAGLTKTAMDTLRDGRVMSHCSADGVRSPEIRSVV